MRHLQFKPQKLFCICPTVLVKSCNDFDSGSEINILFSFGAVSGLAQASKLCLPHIFVFVLFEPQVSSSYISYILGALPFFNTFCLFIYKKKDTKVET